MHRAPLVWIILIATIAMAPQASAAEDGLAARALEYRDSLASLPLLQNGDGGWGRPELPANSTMHTTTMEPGSFLETVLTVDLLIIEQTDPYRTTTNWEDVRTSLAASNESSALDWLRDYETRAAATLTPGQHALAAIAYAELGDAGNARRVLGNQLDSAAAGSWQATDVARLLMAHARVPVQYNETQNATLTDLDATLAAASPTTTHALSWALLAQPDDAARADALAARVTDPSGIDVETLALAAWALASADALDTSEALLVDLHQRNPVGLARIFTLHAGLTAHPEFSPHALELPLAEGVSTFIGRTDAGSSITSTPAPQAPPATEFEATPADEGARFPLPVWLMATIILVAVSALIVVGLAYGLKREDLQGSRRDIFAYIEKNPGAHFSKIRRDLGYAPGTFQHHLSVLESEGWITSHKESRYKRYFVNGNRYQKLIAGYTYKQRFAALANETTRNFVSYLKDHPGATQKQVAARLNIHASTVNWHAKRLQQAGILEPRRVGKEVQYHVDAREVDKMLDVPDETRSLMVPAA